MTNIISNPIDLFRENMTCEGIIPTSEIIADGRLHRAHVDGDRKGTKNLAYILHLDGRPAGWWQYFKTGVSGTWSINGKREPMTAAMKKQIAYAKEVREVEQAKAHQQAAEKARWIWDKATPLNEKSQHPYLIRKRVKPHGAKLYKSALVIPIYDGLGALVNLQFIGEDGTKRFLTGGKKQGCYFCIGTPTETILICEGFATGASLHQETQLLTVIAFDAGNLEQVARRPE